MRLPNDGRLALCLALLVAVSSASGQTEKPGRVAIGMLQGDQMPSVTVEITTDGWVQLNLLATRVDGGVQPPSMRLIVEPRDVRAWATQVRAMMKTRQDPTQAPEQHLLGNGNYQLNVTHLWRDDFVGFVLGCSFTFESALIAAGIPLKHLALEQNVAMYRTNIACEAAGPFAGPLVVSMRPLTPSDAERATEITARFPMSHGAPVHIGDPERIGITDLSTPDYGDAVDIAADEVPVFWACGVTPQAALANARIPFAITHAPGCMLVTDLRDVPAAMRGRIVKAHR